jgi:hypothetical protein
MACGEAPRLAILTLILYDIIPNSVRSARGRSHEASCGWDRMRRPRPGEDVSPAPGRRRELRPAATMSRPPGAWLSGADRPPCASPKTRSQGGSNGRSLQSAARRSKEDAAMARHEAPASLERERGTKRTMVAPPGAPSPSRLRGGNCGKRRQACPGPRQTTWAITLGFQRHRKCCRLPTPVTTLQQL